MGFMTYRNSSDERRNDVEELLRYADRPGVRGEAILRHNHVRQFLRLVDIRHFKVVLHDRCAPAAECSLEGLSGVCALAEQVIGGAEESFLIGEIHHFELGDITFLTVGKSYDDVAL